jgi:hypothetical protein
MGGLDRFVGNETGPPKAARRVKASEWLSSTPHPSDQNSLRSVVIKITKRQGINRYLKGMVAMGGLEPPTPAL